MARRKKEPPETHRQHISEAAERLFSAGGVRSVTVDDIAREAGYSKATLYVYFRDKEEIVRELVLKSMKLLHAAIHEVVAREAAASEKYRLICLALERFQESYPYYFRSALGPVPLDFGGAGLPPVEQEIFDTGELINREVAGLLAQGMEEGVFRRNLEILPTVFVLWAGLSGLICMAADKCAYIETVLRQSRREFLDRGYDMLYRTIAAGGAIT